MFNKNKLNLVIKTFFLNIVIKFEFLLFSLFFRYLRNILIRLNEQNDKLSRIYVKVWVLQYITSQFIEYLSVNPLATLYEQSIHLCTCLYYYYTLTNTIFLLICKKYSAMKIYSLNFTVLCLRVHISINFRNYN